MKKVIAWPLMWSLFWLGHGVSRIMVGRLGHLYPLYNWLMLKSSELQDWSGLKGPWGPEVTQPAQAQE